MADSDLNCRPFGSVTLAPQSQPKVCENTLMAETDVRVVSILQLQLSSVSQQVLK